jgi:hypothetical protein
MQLIHFKYIKQKQTPMKLIKQLGIWMDHSTANLIELSNDKIVKRTLKIEPDFLGPLENLRLNEGQTHNTAQDHQYNFHKQLSYVIHDYNEVLLFGSSDAKNELLNVLKNNHRFDKTKISVQPTENMTDNQKDAFVKDFFNAHSEVINSEGYNE